MKTTTATFLIILLLTSSGCRKGSKTDQNPAASASGATSGGPIGVGNCDEYLSTYKKCMVRSPAQQKSLQAQADNIRAIADNPEDRPLLEKRCTTALESLRALCP